MQYLPHVKTERELEIPGFVSAVYFWTTLVSYLMAILVLFYDFVPAQEPAGGIQLVFEVRTSRK